MPATETCALGTTEYSRVDFVYVAQRLRVFFPNSGENVRFGFRIVSSSRVSGGAFSHRSPHLFTLSICLVCFEARSRTPSLTSHPLYTSLSLCRFLCRRGEFRIYIMGMMSICYAAAAVAGIIQKHEAQPLWIYDDDENQHTQQQKSLMLEKPLLGFWSIHDIAYQGV